MDVFRLRFGLFPVSRLFLRPSRTAGCLRLVQAPLPCHSTLTSRQVPDGPTSPPPIVLRDYQEECIQSVLHYLDQGHNRLGVSLATGSGKTVRILSNNGRSPPADVVAQVIFTQLIGRIPPRNEYGNKTLIIVHRKELVEQAARHCSLAYPDLRVEIEMGNSTATAHGDIIIASIQSLVSKDRYLKFAPSMFKLILVDEAHHIVAQSYRTALEHFGLSDPSQDSPALVGVSATLSRFDGLKLGAAIDHIVYHKDYVDMIDTKWLSNAVFTTVKSQANLSKVRKDKFGDFALGSLSRAVNTETTNNITVRAWLAYARERKSTLVFCVDVDHARVLTDTFRSFGVDARYMTARTPKHVRAEQLLAFKNQEFPVLLNCGLFTEGTDIPNVDCVLLARPTRSKNLLIQMIGRGLRLYPGKENCHIIDMVASLEAGVLSTPTLFGLHPDEVLDKSSASDLEKRRDGSPPNLPDASQPEPRVLPEDQVDVTITKYDNIYDLIKEVNLEKHIRSLSHNAWVRTGLDRYVLSNSSGWLTIEHVPAHGNNNTDNNPDEMYQVRLVTKFKSSSESTTYTRPRLIAEGPDLETAVHAADTYAANEFESRYIRTDMSWRKAWATGNQLQMLNRSRFRKRPLRPSEITRGQAADMITRLKLGGTQWLDSLDKRMSQNVKLMELRKREEVRVGPVAS